MPLSTDAQGHVLREVAPARIVLQRPGHPGEGFVLRVALIRDLHRMVEIKPSPAEVAGRIWDAEPPPWWDEGWQATPAPPTAVTAKLIPIVSTTETGDAVELARTYIRRWPVQENVIKDYLRPLGIDINHGFAKTEVPNSEVAKRRSQLEKRLARLQQWAKSAGQRQRQAKERLAHLQVRFDRICQQLSRDVGELQTLPPLGSETDPLSSQQIQARHAKLDALPKPMSDKREKLEQRYQQDQKKQERYCQEQREVLRALKDLSAKERNMYELDNRKDQVMTVCKLAVANLAMWVRDKYFPASYAHATRAAFAPVLPTPRRHYLGCYLNPRPTVS